MQIAVTKKLAQAAAMDLQAPRPEIDPLFCWTANWMKVWHNRRSEDLLILVNNATRFAVAVYEVRKKQLKNIGRTMETAIVHTLQELNFNPQLIEEYFRLAGEMEFVPNRDLKAAAWVTTAGERCARFIVHHHDAAEKVWDDTVAIPVNFLYVNYTKNQDDAFIPYKRMIKALSSLTGLPGHKYRAFELLVTLDLGVYPAVRRIIVPADITFPRLHEVLQDVYAWENSHLYDFEIIGEEKRRPVAKIVLDEEVLDFIENGVLMGQHRLSEFFPQYQKMIYTYDMGDTWEHEIELVRILEDHDQPSPYLLEAQGQAPPEDSGGVSGFMRFYEAMQDPHHPDHARLKEWAGRWRPYLFDWESRPHLIQANWIV